MSVQITTAFRKQYSAAFELVFQQTASELENTVRRDRQSAEYYLWDYIGKGTAYRDPARHSDTQYDTVPHTRRRNQLHTCPWAELIDKPDRVMTLVDPTSDYIRAGVAALNREKDKLILEALGGIAYTGKEGNTAVNVYDVGESRLLESDDVVVTAGSNFTNKTATGLTLKKIGSIADLLADADVPAQDRHMVCNWRNMLYLSGSGRATSTDFITQQVLTTGSSKSLMGFQFHWLPNEYFTENTTDTECIECYAWHRDAVLFATNGEIETTVDVLPAKNNSTQVYASIMAGGTRLQGPGVVKFLIKKSPALDFTQT